MNPHDQLADTECVRDTWRRQYEERDRELGIVRQKLDEANTRIDDLKAGIESANTRWLDERKAREALDRQLLTAMEWHQIAVNERLAAEACAQKWQDACSENLAAWAVTKEQLATEHKARQEVQLQLTQSEANMAWEEENLKRKAIADLRESMIESLTHRAESVAVALALKKAEHVCNQMQHDCAEAPETARYCAEAISHISAPAIAAEARRVVKDAARWEHAEAYGFPVRNQSGTETRRWIAFGEGPNGRTEYFGTDPNSAVDQARKQAT